MLPILRARTTKAPITPQSSISAPEPMARIWLTYKTRILSEQRYKGYALISHLALTWYAFLSIVFSIYQTNISVSLGSSGSTQVSLVISVLTFGLSLIIYGFKFEDNARVHRDCYLRMQSVYQSAMPDAEKLEEYRKLLDHFPNHSRRDYQRLLFSGWKADRALTGTDGLPIKFTGLDASKEYAFYFMEWTMLTIVFLVPLALILQWIGSA